MKNTTITLVILALMIGGCKKQATLVGHPMSVTRNGTTIRLDEVNIFTPNGDGINDQFRGPLFYNQTDSLDNVTNVVLKVSGNIISNYWDGTFNSSEQPEGLYNYEADYTTHNGTAKATGLVRLWKHSTVPCAEKNLYVFPDLIVENIPCN
jgi:hypothetical protein